MCSPDYEYSLDAGGPHHRQQVQNSEERKRSGPLQRSRANPVREGVRGQAHSGSWVSVEHQELQGAANSRPICSEEPVRNKYNPSLMLNQ